MTPELVCPGCGGKKYGNDLCCGACWNRIPRDLPNWPYWRTALKRNRQVRGWISIEKIIEEARRWLLAHPKTTKRGC
jgi:predicted amidophosphoribosyltransferase